jgi:transcriptional regulator
MRLDLYPGQPRDEDRRAMFVRPSWRPRTLEEMYRLIEQHPWALLVSNGDDGPYATNLPLLLDRAKGERGTLVGHIARGNEHALVLESALVPTLAVFEGPYSYVTPAWYPNRDMPSTYYYTAVHCRGRVRVQTDAELLRWLDVLTKRMEAEVPNGWSIGEVARSEITRRLPLIMGFELEIERLEGKFKLGQDEPKRDALAVARELARSPDPSHRALAELTCLYNEDRPDESG